MYSLYLGPAACRICGHRWQFSGVVTRPLGEITDLVCPACGHASGDFGIGDEDDEDWLSESLTGT